MKEENYLFITLHYNITTLLPLRLNLFYYIDNGDRVEIGKS